MGNFYVNFITRGADQKTIAQCLQRTERKAYVSLTRDGITVFYDDECDSQDIPPILTVGKVVSRDLQTPVLAVLNHDDDVLIYWLFEKANVVDGYISTPDYFAPIESIPVKPSPKKLCSAFAAPQFEKQVKKVLEDDEYAFALDRHRELAKLLNLPWQFLCIGYRDVHSGNLPKQAGTADFLRVK